MAWARLDDRLNDADSKLLAVSDAAHRMYSCGLIYVSKALTDGFIPEHVIETFGVRARNKRAVAEELCTPLVPGKQPLWHRVPGGYQVHDYLDWNDDKETVITKRRRSAERVNKFRHQRPGGAPCNALQTGVTTRVTPPVNVVSVTRSVRTDPRTTYLASLGTPPRPPRAGGALHARPRDLRKQAKLIRDKAWGRCQHDPPCADYASCLAAIAADLAQREEAAS